jgi:hypothetical protein
MRYSDIAKTLNTVKSFSNATFEMRAMFTKQMRGCQYGIEALVDAWAWFEIGWRCANVQAMISAASQINSPQNLVPSHVPGLDL